MEVKGKSNMNELPITKYLLKLDECLEIGFPHREKWIKFNSALETYLKIQYPSGSGFPDKVKRSHIMFIYLHILCCYIYRYIFLLRV